MIEGPSGRHATLAVWPTVKRDQLSALDVGDSKPESQSIRYVHKPIIHLTSTVHPCASTRRPDDLSLMTGPPRTAPGTQRTMRCAAEHRDTGKRFLLQQKSFGNQYAQIYFFRLQRLQPQMRKKAMERWKGVEVRNILNVPENSEVALIGTVYKEMKLKPSILAEYTKDRGLEQLIGKSKFTSPGDTLVLEDTSARVQLRGSALSAGDLVTGVVIAVKGTAVPGGDFWVTDMFSIGLKPQPPLPPADGTRYVALLSGLDLGDAAADPVRLSLLLDFLTGMLGSSPEQTMASQVVRTVIAGGLMCATDTLASAATHTSGRQQSAALAPVREMDMAITELAGTMPVDLMPGASDPASRSLPQQPLHDCLFPGAAAFETVTRVTNPYEFELEGVAFLGTSGQNVDDIYKYSDREDRLGILAACLEWGHLVPTAPDTLGSYPFAMDDPFLLERAPHVLFAGNQPRFETRVHTGADGQKVSLVCVPKFSETGALVLVNLGTLDMHPIYFDA